MAAIFFYGILKYRTIPWFLPDDLIAASSGACRWSQGEYIARHRSACWIVGGSLDIFLGFVIIIAVWLTGTGYSGKVIECRYVAVRRLSCSTFPPASYIIASAILSLPFNLTTYNPQPPNTPKTEKMASPMLPSLRRSVLSLSSRAAAGHVSIRGSSAALRNTRRALVTSSLPRSPALAHASFRPGAYSATAVKGRRDLQARWKSDDAWSFRKWGFEDVRILLLILQHTHSCTHIPIFDTDE